MHNDLIKSGLAASLEMNTETESAYLSEFLNTTVKFKDELANDAHFISKYGTITKTSHFVIRHVQKNHKNKTVLRGYATSYDDTFGRVINPKHIEIVK